MIGFRVKGLGAVGLGVIGFRGFWAQSLGLWD